MGILFGLIQLVVPVAIIGVIIAAIVAWRRHDEVEDRADEGIGTVRRIYFYGVAFVSLIVAAVGVVLVGRYVLDELFGPAVITRTATQLALGVALAVIWMPVWVWHWQRVQRYAREEPAEYSSPLRQLYVYAILAVATGFAVFGFVDDLRMIFQAQSFGGFGIAASVVWSLVWVYHWQIASEDSRRTGEVPILRRLYVYLASAVGLAMLAVGLGFVLYLVLREAYEGLFPVPRLLQGEDLLWGDTMKTTLAVAMVGSVVWAWHWLYAAHADATSLLRQFYVYVLAILGGVLVTLIAGGIIINETLVWLIGTPDESTAAAHFRFLPATLAILPIGVALWSYHWWAVQREQAAFGQLAIARRVYAYIMTGIGIGGLAVAIVILVATVIELLVTDARDVLAGEDWWRNQIVAVITLGVLGAPVWAYYWFSMQRRVAIDGTEERTNRARYVLLFGVLCVGGLAFLGGFSFLLFKILEVLLGDAASATLLRSAKWSIGAMVASAVFTPYYLLVLLEDRKISAEQAAAEVKVTKPVTILIGEDGTAFIEHLEEVLGRKVRVLHRAEPGVQTPELADAELESLKQRILEAAGSRVLLIADGTEVQVLSYR